MVGGLFAVICWSRACFVCHLPMDHVHTVDSTTPRQSKEFRLANILTLDFPKLYKRKQPGGRGTNGRSYPTSPYKRRRSTKSTAGKEHSIKYLCSPMTSVCHAGYDVVKLRLPLHIRTAADQQRGSGGRGAKAAPALFTRRTSAHCSIRYRSPAAGGCMISWLRCAHHGSSLKLRVASSLDVFRWNSA